MSLVLFSSSLSTFVVSSVTSSRFVSAVAFNISNRFGIFSDMFNQIIVEYFQCFNQCFCISYPWVLFLRKYFEMVKLIFELRKIGIILTRFLIEQQYTWNCEDEFGIKAFPLVCFRSSSRSFNFWLCTKGSSVTWTTRNDILNSLHQ